jgi:hypothetical protein
MGLMRRDGVEEETLGKVEDDVLIKKPSHIEHKPIIDV